MQKARFYITISKAIKYGWRLGFLVTNIWLGFAYQGTCETPPISNGLFYPSLVDSIYQLRHGNLLWYGVGQVSLEMRIYLVDKLDSAHLMGLTRKYDKYIREVGNPISGEEWDSSYQRIMDRVLTDAAIAYSIDLFTGRGASGLILYDGISPSYVVGDQKRIIADLARVYTPDALSQFFSGLEPAIWSYRLLRDWQLRKSDSLSPSKRLQIKNAIAYSRWIHHFKFGQRIVVNIPEATLRYYKGDSLQLQMNVVLGKPRTRTPRFSAYCNEIVLYPYWNVPRSIAIKEFLPKIKNDPHVLEEMNIQLLNDEGRILNPLKVNWSNYSRSYFPFELRQSTGCDNSLGVIKFDVNSPFSVYLHDTNYKNAFRASYRFLSHGCIRLEKPLEMAQLILPQQIDSTLITSCLKNQQPMVLKLEKSVPVFVIYQTAVARENGEVYFLKDIYGILN